ncbi:MAG: phage tail assembly chaperone family protein, TAC [Klebsiella pneumoniae]|nr:phage tail assembly chaperone family protein, TAC [Klebsiella pneumoniae]
MQLTLDTLKETGAFTGRPVEKEIKWKGRDGKEHIATVYVRPMGYHTTKAELLAYNGLGTASEDRGALDGPIVIALLAVIQEVNDLGKTTNSQEKTSSGVS